jgi:DNA-binding transcriptional ArsR family regulator
MDNSACKRMDKNQIEKLTIPPPETIARMSAIFQALQSSARLNILFFLKKKDMCVCELSEALEASQSAISHNMRILRQLDLVRVRKEGRFAVYYIADEHVRLLIETCRQHILEEYR